ncbi:MAG TPA: DUF1559 domain-containing protein [Gemmataceae bacterium]|jgi:hypothetical protein|nr:DUF1559 domain-containing protein [Gemmataceae bacterium]
MPFLRALFVAAVATSLSIAQASAQTSPADLVPADATGFLHVPLAELVKSKSMKPYRDLLAEAGEAYAIFERRVVPSIKSLENLTMYFRVTDPKAPPAFVIILTTTKDIEPVAFVKQWLPDSREENAGKGRIYFNEKHDVAVRFQGPRTIVFGPLATIRSEAAKAFVREGPLAAALKKATGSRMVAALDPSFVAAQPQAQAQVPPPFQPLLKMKLAVLSTDVAKSNRLDVHLSFPTAADAEAGEKSLRTAMDMARQAMVAPRQQMMAKLQGEGPIPLDQLGEAAGAVFVVGAIDKADKFLAAPPLTRKDTGIDIALDIPPGLDNLQLSAPLMIGLLVPAVQKVREAASRMQGANNLKQLALAMHNYHDTYNKFPSSAICDKNGKALLSWRVAILPYVDQNDLYKKFKLDEPWNSAHNKKLIPLMPTLYEIPGNASTPGLTHVRVFVGGGALFDLNNGVKMQQVTDGTSNTIMMVQTADAVTWTAPNDIPFGPNLPLPKQRASNGGRFTVALADGSVQTLPANVPEATLRALITRAGGEVIPNNVFGH